MGINGFTLLQLGEEMGSFGILAVTGVRGGEGVGWVRFVGFDGRNGFVANE
jgi:hypothetical protein